LAVPSAGVAIVIIAVIAIFPTCTYKAIAAIRKDTAFNTAIVVVVVTIIAAFFAPLSESITATGVLTVSGAGVSIIVISIVTGFPLIHDAIAAKGPAVDLGGGATIDGRTGVPGESSIQSRAGVGWSRGPSIELPTGVFRRFAAAIGPKRFPRVYHG